MQPSSLEIAHFAGIVDGEGHLSLYMRGNSATFNFFIANTNGSLILHYLLMFGGSICPVIKGRYRPCWRLYFPKSIAAPILRVIIPHLVIKREQARILRVYCDIIGDSTCHLSIENRQKVFALAELCWSISPHRGILGTSMQ